MFMFANATKGKIAAFDKETCGCWGGGAGPVFGNACLRFSGGEECFALFLSSGKAQWETGEAVGKAVEEQAGAYLITICTQDRRCLLGESWMAECG